MARNSGRKTTVDASLASGMCESASNRLPRKCACLATVSPKAAGSWLKPIVMATATVKPSNTALGMYSMYF